MKRSPPPGPRARIGADRRGRTRVRLIEAALLVFAQRGADGSVIEEVIRTAGVARGTFYNYFRTNEELFIAVAEEVGNEIMRAVTPTTLLRPPGAARVAAGVRMTLMLAQQHPHMASFLGRTGTAALGLHSLATEVVPGDIADGIAVGQFDALDPRLAFDLVVGPVLAAFTRIGHERLPPSFPEQMAQAVLCSLGLGKARARRLATVPLESPVVEADSLLARVEALARRRAT